MKAVQNSVMSRECHRNYWCMMTSSNGNISLYWPFVRGIHRSPVDSHHKGQWRGALMYYLVCTWTNGWAIEMLVSWDALALIMTSLLWDDSQPALYVVTRNSRPELYHYATFRPHVAESWLSKPRVSSKKFPVAIIVKIRCLFDNLFMKFIVLDIRT